MVRALLTRGAAASTLLLAACAGGGGHSAQGGDGVAHVGNPAPTWSESTSRGSRFDAASLHGKVAYLNFFATWCPPCNEEAPTIDALQRQYGARGLQVVGIDVLENARKAGDFQRQHGLSYPVVVDDGTLRGEYAVNGLPVHVFIDRQGIVRSIVVGEISARDMRANVLRLLR